VPGRITERGELTVRDGGPEVPRAARQEVSR